MAVGNIYPLLRYFLKDLIDTFLSYTDLINLYPSDLILSILVTIFYDYLSSDQILSAVVTVFVQSLIV